MHTIFEAIIIGIVEGLTEFLPVSSTGHMILAQSLLNTQNDEVMKTFDFVIQLGAIMAVVLIYWKRILSLFGLVKRKSESKSGKKLNLLHILIGIIPAGIIGVLFNDFVDEKLFNSTTVLIGLVLGGILLIIAEKKKEQPSAVVLDDLTYRQAFFIGLWQLVSIWPGFSRSGSTIAGGMLSGVSRAASADFTFIMAIPIMFGASGVYFLKNYEALSSNDLGFFIVGFVVAFIVALLAVVTFIKLVQNMKLTYFAYYRFAVAIIFALYMYLK
ncbi:MULTISPECIES: undecaprenyl-diphosphate phosphatase [unclassified Paenibacillus]|uniref:undecaprenyl-diphosphate phosphatase n=1 Tax=unclassified Paenibacillus TaxID=185978 RepID=UPI00070A126C|nr:MULTISPECIES: undecaprenyl-diphosphate phosphatase [unclassified Paenibacillus]KQX45854.1 UDP pyrophosphate phosphatase [Paenibacillus sp. Root444D2]KRE50808.1 UDP pyrophosphate phosphatase [Paenibacillus sp. Soil724D2]